MKLTKLQAAVLEQLSGIGYEDGGAIPSQTADEMQLLQDVANHGVDGRVSGFTYYHDTCAFTMSNWDAIIAECREMMDSMGEPDTLAQCIAGFNCLKGCSPAEVEEVLMTPRKETQIQQQVLNALALFALEEVAHQLVEG